MPRPGYRRASQDPGKAGLQTEEYGMRFSLWLAAAALLAGPALAQPTRSKSPDELRALDKDCKGGSVQACTEASISRGPSSGPDRPGGGKAGARDAEESHRTAPGAGGTATGGNATPRYSGEGGGMPAPQDRRR
jgi:hypothetical protein